MKRQNIRKSTLLVSFLLFPLTLFFFSPALPIEGAFKGVIVGSIIVFPVLFALSLLLGRVFCGWLCPGSALQEYCSAINDKKLKPRSKIYMKYVIWMLWIGGIMWGFISYGQFPKINMLTSTYYGISVHQPWIYLIYYAVLGLITIPAVIIGERAFCRYICWMAPFMVTGNKIKDFFRWPALRLHADKDKCNNCKLCNKKCPMSIDVNQMVKKSSIMNSECILCGCCVDACPRGALRYSFSRINAVLLKVILPAAIGIFLFIDLAQGEAQYLRPVALVEKPVNETERIFTEDGYLNVHVLRKLIDDTFDDINSSNIPREVLNDLKNLDGLEETHIPHDMPPEAKPLIIGSALYMADADGRVRLPLIEDVDMMFFGPKRGEFDYSDMRKAFVRLLHYKLGLMIGRRNLSEITRGYTGDVDMDVFMFYEFKITKPDGSGIEISFPPVNYGISADKFLQEDISEILVEVANYSANYNMWLVECAGYYDKVAKKCLRTLYYVTAYTGNMDEFLALKDKYAKAMGQGFSDKDAASRNFLEQYMFPALRRLDISGLYQREFSRDPQFEQRLQGFARELIDGHSLAVRRVTPAAPGQSVGVHIPQAVMSSI